MSRCSVYDMLFSGSDTMKKVYKNGISVVFKLDDTMKRKNYSKNKLCVETGLRFETIQGYYNGTISRIDLYVISQLCKTLNCNIGDIVEYFPR